MEGDMERTPRKLSENGEVTIVSITSGSRKDEPHRVLPEEIDLFDTDGGYVGKGTVWFRYVDLKASQTEDSDKSLVIAAIDAMMANVERTLTSMEQRAPRIERLQKETRAILDEVEATL
jgi:hypothetical protein